MIVAKTKREDVAVQIICCNEKNVRITGLAYCSKMCFRLLVGNCTSTQNIHIVDDMLKS